MIKLIIKNAFFCTMLFALSACGDKVDSSITTANSPELTTLVIGKGYYEDVNTSCADCHGDSGDGTSSINLETCVACSDIDSLASYIDQYMPPLPAYTQSCSLDGEDSCAYTTAAGSSPLC